MGLAAAAALGESPTRVLKTLMTRFDGKPACAILPSDRELSMTKLAQALGGKPAQMMSPADAERLTGYKVCGISPQPTIACISAGFASNPDRYSQAFWYGCSTRVSDPGTASRRICPIWV